MVRVQNGGVILVRNGVLPWENKEFYLEDAFDLCQQLQRCEIEGIIFRGNATWMMLDANDHEVCVDGVNVGTGLFVVQRSGKQFVWFKTNGRKLRTAA